MATVVDNRVVSMEFDNAKFEQNVAESLGTLKKLSNSLDTLGEGSASGLQKLTDMIGNISFDKMADGIESIADKFTLLGQIGQRVIGGIADSVVGMVSKLKSGIDSVTVDQIAEGWGKYAEKTTAVQTIMNATGKSIEEVSAQLDKLMWFTDETSYNFSDMSNSIGKFTSNGQDLEKSVIAMEGIANWTAISGQGAAQASIAMYNLSQALSAGSVKAMDWKSIELANMATKEFRETVLETAADMGTLKKKSEGVYETIATTGKKTEEVTVTSFRNALEKGFFTSDVLMAVLQKYGSFTQELNAAYEKTGLSATDLLKATDDLKNGTKTADEIFEEFEEDLEGTGVTAEELGAILEKLGSDEYELGRKAFAAGQEAKTFTDAINAVKDAASSAWLRVFENIFGNYEEAKKLWTTMANDLYDIFVQDIDTLNDAIEGAGSSAWDTLTDEIDKAGMSVSDFEIAMSEMAEGAGYDMDGLISKYGTLSAALKSYEFGGWLNNNKNIITKALESLGLSDEVVAKSGMNAEEIAANADEIRSIVIKDWWGKYGTGDEREQAIRALGYDPDVIAQLAKDWEASNPGDPYWRKILSVEELIKAMASEDEATKQATKSWEEFDEIIANSDFSKINFRQAIAQGITSSLEFIINDMNIFREAWQETFYAGMSRNDIMEKRSNALRKFAASFASVAGRLAEITSEGSDTAAFFTNVTQGILMFGKIAYDVFAGLFTFVNPLLKLFGYFAAPILAALAALGAAYNTIQQLLGDLNPIRVVLESISEILGTVIDLAWKFGGGVFTKLFGNDLNVGEKFSKSLESIAKWLERVTQKFVNLKERVAEAKSLREALGIIGDAFVGLGKKILPTQEELQSFFTKENLTKQLENLKVKTVNGIRSFGKAVISEWTGYRVDSEHVGQMWHNFETLFKGPDAAGFASAKRNIEYQIRDIGKTMVASLLGVDKDSAEAIKGWYKIEYAIRHPLKTLKNAIVHPLKALGNAIKNIDMKAVFNSVVSGLSSGWATVKSWFSLIDWRGIWDSFTKSLTDVVNELGGFFQIVWDAIVELYGYGVEYVKEKTGANSWKEFFDWLQGEITTKFNNFIDELSSTLKSGFKTVLTAFGMNEEDATAIVDSIWNFFGSIRTQIGNLFEGFSIFGETAPIVESIGSSISDVTSGVYDWVVGKEDATPIDGVVAFFNGIGDKISGINFKGIFEALSNMFSWLKTFSIFIINIASSIAHVITLLRTGWAIGTLIKTISGIGKSIQRIKNAKANMINAEAIYTIGKTLLAVASSFVIIAAAIWLMGELVKKDFVGMVIGAAAVAVIAYCLTRLIKSLLVIQSQGQSLKKKYVAFKGMGEAFIGMAAAIVIMVIAMRMIANTDLGGSAGEVAGNIVKIVAGLALAVIALTFLTKASKNLSGAQSTGLAVMFVAMAAAILIVAAAMKKVCEVDPNINGLFLAITIGLMGAIAYFVGKDSIFKSALKGCLVLGILAVELVGIAHTLKQASGIDNLLETAAILAGTIVVLGGVAAGLGYFAAFTGIGAMILGILVLALVGLGYGLQVAAEGLRAFSAIAPEFATGLKTLCEIDFLTLVEGLGKLVTIIIALGAASLTLTSGSGAKIGSMVTALTDLATNMEAISAGLNKLSELGIAKDGKDKASVVETSMNTLKTIFSSLCDSTVKGWITDFLNGDDDDLLTKAANSLVKFAGNIDDIGAAITLFSTGVGVNAATATEKIKELIKGLYDAEKEAKGSDFSTLSSLGSNLSIFSMYTPKIEKVIADLSNYGTKENEAHIDTAINILKKIIGSKEGVFSESTGLISVLQNASNIDFTKLNQMSAGLASFADIKPALDVFATLEGFDASRVLAPLTETFGKGGVIPRILEQTFDWTNLTTMSTAMASFADTFSKIPNISATVLEDLIAKSDEFIKTGEDLLKAFLEGLKPTNNQKIDNVGTTDLITVVLQDFKSREDEWREAGESAAAAFMSGLTGDTDSLISSTEAMVSEMTANTSIPEGYSIPSSGLGIDSSSGIDATSLMKSLFGGTGSVDFSSFVNMESLSGMFNITDIFGGLGTDGTFDLSSMLNLGDLKESLNFTDMFSGLGTDGTFDFSTIMNTDSLKDSLNFTDMFSGLGTDGTYDASTLFDFSSVEGSLDAESLFGLEGDEKIDISQYISTDGLSTSISTALSESITGISTNDQGISTAVETLMNTGVKAVTDSGDSWKRSGAKVMGDAITGIKNCSGLLKKSCDKLMTDALTAITDTKEKWKAAGTTLVEALKKAISDQGPAISGAAFNVAMSGVTGARNTYNSWYQAGVYLDDGLRRGIIDNRYGVSDAAAMVASNAIAKAKQVLNERSPSRVFMQIGRYVSEGFAIGIKDEQGQVVSASEALANSAISTATTAQALIANILETDATPVIRPVLDLSEIQSQASYVSSMFGTSSLNVGSISARVSNLSSAIEMAKAQNQNGLNQPLTASLDAQSMQAILASGNKPIEVNTNIGFEGSLSQLATILYPYIKNEVNRIGPSYVNSNR